MSTQYRPTVEIKGGYQQQEFHYHVPWRTRSATPGRHHSTQFGGGYEFHGHAPLVSHPDPRKIDIHASLHDPFGQYVVRTFRQRSSIPVYVIADLSASMGIQGRQNKMRLLTEFSQCTAYSAYRNGDPFGFIPCSNSILWDLFTPLRWNRGITQSLTEKLSHYVPHGQSVDGIMETRDIMGKQRSLVFLISDFHFPIEFLRNLLKNLIPHDVVPIVIWDSPETAFPNWGIVRLIDSESKQERCLFLRPKLRERIIQAYEERRVLLKKTFTEFGREALFLTAPFNADQLTAYFSGNG